MPDTCAPTSTVVTACSVPVATTRRLIDPTVTSAVVTVTLVIVWNAHDAAAADTIASTPSPIQIERRIRPPTHRRAFGAGSPTPGDIAKRMPPAAPRTAGICRRFRGGPREARARLWHLGGARQPTRPTRHKRSARRG